MNRLRRAVTATVCLLVLTSVTGCGLLEDGAYDLPLPGGADVGQDARTMTIHIRDVEGLVQKSEVKLNNVAVGQVDDIAVNESDWTAEVTATVRGDLELPADVQARVRRSSLLGEWYVELVKPGQQAGSTQGQQRNRAVREQSASDDPDVIPLRRTDGSAAVEEVLGALSLLLNNGALPQLNTIVVELNRALGGNESETRQLLSDLTELTGQLDDNKDAIVRALDGLADLSGTLRRNEDQIERLLEEIPPGLEVLADQRPQLTRMLASFERLSDVAVRVVNQSKEDVVADLELLEPTLRGLAQAGQNLPKALEILATFPFTPGTMGAFRGDYVNLDSKVDLDLEAVLATLLASNQPLNLGGQDLPNPLAILKGDATGNQGSPQQGSPPGTGDAPADQRTPNPGSDGLGGLLSGLLGGTS